MQKTNNVQLVYKTTVISTKHKVCIDVNPPDDQFIWELHSIISRKNKLLYTWSRPANVNTFSSTEEAFQKSLDMVRTAASQLAQEVEIKSADAT